MNVKPKILYVDDESELLNLASAFFEDEALPIDTCGNFSEALNKIREGSYDLIISDARMPTGSGKELFSIIKAENLSCRKFVLVTGNLDFKDDDKDNIYDLILFKPIGFLELVKQVKKLLNT